MAQPVGEGLRIGGVTGEPFQLLAEGFTRRLVFHEFRLACLLLLSLSFIGFASNIVYREKTISLEQGDIVLLYSDGLIELADSDSGIILGTDYLMEILEENARLSSSEIVHSIFDTVYKHINYRLQEGDMTVICIKRL